MVWVVPLFFVEVGEGHLFPPRLYFVFSLLNLFIWLYCVLVVARGLSNIAITESRFSSCGAWA